MKLETVFTPCQDQILTVTRDNVFDGVRQRRSTVYFRTEPLLSNNIEKKPTCKDGWQFGRIA
jgi:hypothetical protein